MTYFWKKVSKTGREGEVPLGKMQSSVYCVKNFAWAKFQALDNDILILVASAGQDKQNETFYLSSNYGKVDVLKI